MIVLIDERGNAPLCVSATLPIILRCAPSYAQRPSCFSFPQPRSGTAARPAKGTRVVVKAVMNVAVLSPT